MPRVLFISVQYIKLWKRFYWGYFLPRDLISMDSIGQIKFTFSNLDFQRTQLGNWKIFILIFTQRSAISYSIEFNIFMKIVYRIEEEKRWDEMRWGEMRRKDVRVKIPYQLDPNLKMLWYPTNLIWQETNVMILILCWEWMDSDQYSSSQCILTWHVCKDRDVPRTGPRSVRVEVRVRTIQHTISLDSKVGECVYIQHRTGPVHTRSQRNMTLRF